MCICRNLDQLIVSSFLTHPFFFVLKKQQNRATSLSSGDSDRLTKFREGFEPRGSGSYPMAIFKVNVSWLEILDRNDAE